MKGVKTFRNIKRNVTAVQITTDFFSEKVPDDYKDKIVINPASRQVIVYGKGRESVTGSLTDWLVMDETGHLAIIPHANFIDNYEPEDNESPWENSETLTGVELHEVGDGVAIGVDLGSGDSTVTGTINDTTDDTPDDLKTEGSDPISTVGGEGTENIESEN